MEAIEIGVELVVPIDGSDKTPIPKPLEDAVDRVAVVVASGGNLGDGSRLVEIVEHLKGLSSHQLRELNVGVLADEILVEFDGPSIRRNDSFSPAVAFRVDESLLNEVADGSGEVTLAVVELRRELGDRVAAVNRGENLKFDLTEHSVT
jgi:hypothetical protein